MPLIRSDRSDRRRRVMREAVAADPGVAVESVRVKQRRRLREREALDDNPTTLKRDPGYSQAVRRACQQRLVQLIPVRRSSLMIAIAGLWMLWALLMVAHYFVHVQPISNINSLPIAYLVHVRSSHGIAHWLGGQLWMLTALSSLMIFQLRKHKLDDYRAKYRVWGLLAIAALVSSLDASSSGLYLLGMSIDGWARREVGYSGWAIVLATFATLVGILGLRICSEIKSAPMSVTFWLGGLAAWAMSALIGTDLMASPWDKLTTDMVVGGTWLGGILSVFLAGGIYLRHIYIQAQKRFIVRNGMLAQRKAWKLPRFTRRDRTVSEDVDEMTDSESENDALQAGNKRESQSSKSWLPWKRGSNQEVRVSSKVDQERRPAADESTPKRSWLRLPRWKSDPRLGDDFSDVAAERRKRDEGFNEPYGKKRGWFSKKQASTADEQPKERVVDRRSNVSSQSQRDADRDDSIPDFKEVSMQRKSWWKRSPTAKPSKKQTEHSDRSPSTKDGATKESKRKWFQRSTKNRDEDSTADSKPKVKRSWGLLKKKSSNEEKSTPSVSNAPKSVDEKPKRKLFGFLDKLKLKPPADSKPKSTPISVNSNRTPVPSSSAAQRNESSRVESNYNDTRQSQQVDDDDDDDDSNRTLSKADRKRLRRQQENRRAA